jgi:polyisoprenoid-binding protein YceI
MAATHPSSNPRLRAIAAGVAAGGVAAIAAAALSLRLQSPDPILINSASVTLVVLIAGAVAGVIWSLLSDRAHPNALFLLVLAGGFAVFALIVAAVEAAPGQPLPHVATFCLPLALLTVIILAELTPLFARLSGAGLWIAAAAVVVVALGAGGALAGRASTQSGRLALPSLPNAASGTSGAIQPGDITGKSFVVDPSQSKASYSVREQLANLPLPDDAVGTTSDVSGTINLDGRPSTVSVGLTTFKSDNPGRDAHLLRDPGLAKFAPAQFTVTSLDLPSDYKSGDTVTRQVQGTMTINNVEKPMTFSVEGRLQDNTLYLHGQTDFTWADFGIQQPSFGQVLSIADTIHAEVVLAAKQQS